MQPDFRAVFDNGTLAPAFGPVPIFTSDAGETAQAWGKGPGDAVGGSVPRFTGLPYRQNVLEAPNDLTDPAWSTAQTPIAATLQGVAGWFLDSFDAGGGNQVEQPVAATLVASGVYRAIVRLGADAAEVGKLVHLRLGDVANSDVNVELRREPAWYVTPELVLASGSGVTVQIRNTSGDPPASCYFFGACLVRVDGIGALEPGAPGVPLLEHELGGFGGAGHRWAAFDDTKGAYQFCGHELATVPPFLCDLYGRPWVTGAPTVGCVEAGR